MVGCEVTGGLDCGVGDFVERMEDKRRWRSALTERRGRGGGGPGGCG